jgi:hypothetical protein
LIILVPLLSLLFLPFFVMFSYRHRSIERYRVADPFNEDVVRETSQSAFLSHVHEVQDEEQEKQQSQRTHEVHQLSSTVTARRLPVTARPQTLIPILLTTGAVVTSSTQGNLGPPSVVADQSVKDWLKDRWQCATDMSGNPMPLPQYLQMDLTSSCPKGCYISKILLGVSCSVCAWCHDLTSFQCDLVFSRLGNCLGK